MIFIGCLISSLLFSLFSVRVINNKNRRMGSCRCSSYFVVCSPFPSTTTRCFTSESTFDVEDEEDENVLLSILVILLPLSGVGFDLTSTI